MCNWTKWFWPGLVTTALLTALTGWFLSGPVQNDLATRAGNAIKDAGQTWATVAFNGRDGTVSGIAEDGEVQSRAAAKVLETYGVRIVANQSVLPEMVDPYQFSATKNADGITLKGNYSASKAHADFVAAVETAMPGIAVKDEMTLAAGKPEGFDALATFGIGQLADLTGGEVKLSNLEYSIKGDPVDLSAYDKLNAALASALPASGILKGTELSVPPLGSPYPFSASIEDDTVKLEGYAPSVDAKNTIESTAKGLFSGKTISNLLKIAGGAPEGFGSLVEFGLGQLKTLGNGSVSLTDLAYSLKGTPADKATFDALAAATLPAGATVGTLDLVAPAEPAPAQEAAKPFTWSAKSDGTRVALSGDTASEESANDLLLLVKNRFINAGLSNGQTTREGAPGSFAEAQSSLLKTLSYFSSGEAGLADEKARLSGTVPTQELANLISSTAKSRLPQGYELALDVKVESSARFAAAPAAEAIACVDQVKSALSTGEILFASGSANIDSKSNTVLDQIGGVLKSCPPSIIEIGGHTDNEGDDALNLILSDKRANAVRAYLGKALGSVDGLIATGYGETRPVAPNDTPENKAKNRPHRISGHPVRTQTMLYLASKIWLPLLAAFLVGLYVGWSTSTKSNA